MHLPDGFLSPEVWIPLDGVAAGTLGLCIKKSQKHLDEKNIPLMGVMGAFIFAAQMINFPVLAGTSGHLVGSILAATLLGPYTATIVMSAVLIVQCLLFQDGGLTALGANILNMAMIATLLAYPVSIGIQRLFPGEKGRFIGIFISAWLSVVLSAIACAVELAISGTSPLKIVLPAMALVHVVIGIFEGVITIVVIRFVKAVRPDVLALQKV